MVRTHVNPHGGLKLSKKTDRARERNVRTHVNPHGGLKQSLPPYLTSVLARFGPTLILTED